MGLTTIFIIAFGLAMDSFAVSVSCGSIHRKILPKEFLITAFFMGVFQGGMTLIGFYLGRGFKHSIEAWDHWVAFVLLSAIGLKMIYEELRKTDRKPFCPSKINVILALAIATSIDALAVGVTFAFLLETATQPSIIIAVTAFFLSLFGIILGATFSKSRKLPFEIIGGIVLIMIGMKILIEHTLL